MTSSSSSIPPAPSHAADVTDVTDAAAIGAGTPVTDAHIGCRVQCVQCGHPGEIDDVTPGGIVIVRHDAITWCVVPAAVVGTLEAWNVRSS